MRLFPFITLSCCSSIVFGFVPLPKPHSTSTRLASSVKNNEGQESRGILPSFKIPAQLAGAAVLALNVWPVGRAVALPSKPPETNAQALLINALPEKSPIMLDLATSLAKLTTEGSGNIRSIDTKGSKGMKPWPEVLKAQRAATALLSSKGKDLLAGVKASDAKEAEAILESVRTKVSELGAAVEAEDRQAAVKAQVTALRSLDRLGTLEVSKFPYQPTTDYPDVPKLLGRAEVEFTVRSAKTRKTSNMIAVLDGFSAPLSAGHFVDLVQKRAFDKISVLGTDESSVTFAADASKVPKRTVPFEVLAEGDKEPSYGETLEEQGRYQSKVVLPFSAYGTLALSHPPDDPNGDGSSAFFLKADAAYTPAGLNTLDGAYSVIGYVVDGAQALDDLAEGDAIESVRMLSGQQYLK